MVIDPFTVLSAAHCGAKSGSNFVIYVNGDAWMSAPLGPNTAIWGGEKQDLKPNTVAMYQTYDVGRVQDDMVVFVLKDICGCVRGISGELASHGIGTCDGCECRKRFKSSWLNAPSVAFQAVCSPSVPSFGPPQTIAQERVSSAYVPQIPLVATQSYIDSLTEDDTVSLCGFGRQADGTPADLLQCVHLPFKSINHRRCRDNGKDVICVAAQDGRTTCFGDSGGPLYHKPKGTDQFVVLGVLGDGVYPPGTEVFDCAIKLASRYCSVGPKLDWIRSYSKSLITIDSPDTSSVIKKKKEKEQAQLDDGAVGRSVSAFAVLVAVVSSFFP